MKIFLIISILFIIAYSGLFLSAGRALREHIGPGFFVSFLVPMAVGFAVPSAPIFLGTVFVVFLATVKSPIDAVCRFVLLDALLPNASCDLLVGSAYLFSLNSARVLAIGVVLIGLMRRAPGPRVSGKFTPEDLLILAFFVISWIGGTRFPSWTVFLRDGAQDAFLLLSPYIAMRLNIRGPEDMRRVIACITAAAVILAVFALYEAWHHWALYNAINSNLANRHHFVTKNILVRGGFLRPSTAMNGPLMLACYLALATLAAAISRSWFKSTVTWAGCIGVILLGCLACQSRGNAMGIMLGIVLLLALRRNWAAAGLIAGTGALAAAGVVGLATFSNGTAALFNLGTGYAHGGTVYADYRELLLARGMEEGMRHPWIGISLAKNVEHLADITQGQDIVDLVNSYLTIFLISGVVGLTTIVVLMLTVITRIARATRNLTPERQALRAFLLAGMVMIFVQLAFMSVIDRVPMMIGILLVGTRMFMLSMNMRPVTGSAKPVARKRLVEATEAIAPPAWGEPATVR